MDTETDTGNGAESINHDTGNTVEVLNEEIVQQQPRVLRQHGGSNLKLDKLLNTWTESGIPHSNSHWKSRKSQRSSLKLLHVLVQQVS
jgi:hypothetical protein